MGKEGGMSNFVSENKAIFIIIVAVVLFVLGLCALIYAFLYREERKNKALEKKLLAKDVEQVGLQEVGAATYDRITAENGRLTNELSRVSANAGELLGQNRQLTTENLGLSQKNRDLKQRFDVLSRTSDLIIEGRKRLEDEVKAKDDELERMQTAQKTDSTNIEAKNRKIKGYEEKIKELEEKLRVAEKERDEFDQENIQLTAVNEGLSRDLSVLKPISKSTSLPVGKLDTEMADKTSMRVTELLQDLSQLTCTLYNTTGSIPAQSLGLERTPTGLQVKAKT